MIGVSVEVNRSLSLSTLSCCIAKRSGECEAAVYTTDERITVDEPRVHVPASCEWNSATRWGRQVSQLHSGYTQNCVAPLNT